MMQISIESEKREKKKIEPSIFVNISAHGIQWEKKKI